MQRVPHKTVRAKVRPRMRGVFRRFASLGRDGPERWIPLEEALHRIRNRPSFFESLSPEALEMIQNWDGPEVMWPPDCKYRLK
jgi:hypothetical protein